MATVVRRAGCKYWMAAFRDSSGRQHRRSTRETQRPKALVVAQQYERAAKAQGNPQQIRRVLGEFLRDHFNQALPFSNVDEFAQQWLAARKAEVESSTLRKYEETVEKLLAFLGAQAKRGLEEVSRAQITAFRNQRLASAATATANTELKIVRRIFRSARLEGYILQDPAEGVKTVRKRGKQEEGRRPFTLDELRAVLRIADAEWKSLIKFGLYTGQRLGDIARVTWAGIDLEREEIRMFDKKTHKSMLIPMAAPLREHLLTSSAGDNPRAPVHPRAAEIVNSQEERVGTLSNQFSRLLMAAGLREPQPHVSKGIGRSGRRAGMDLSFHSLRHTAVSLLKDAGIPDAVVMALVGHESAAMSQHYTHVGKEALARAAKSLPEI